MKSCFFVCKMSCCACLCLLVCLPEFRCEPNTQAFTCSCSPIFVLCTTPKCFMLHNIKLKLYNHITQLIYTTYHNTAARTTTDRCWSRTSGRLTRRVRRKSCRPGSLVSLCVCCSVCCVVCVLWCVLSCVLWCV